MFKRSLAVIWIHIYGIRFDIYTDLTKLLYTSFEIFLLDTTNKQCFESNLVYFQMYYQLLIVQVLLLIFETFVFVIMFWFLFLELIFFGGILGGFENSDVTVFTVLLSFWLFFIGFILFIKVLRTFYLSSSSFLCFQGKVIFDLFCFYLAIWYIFKNNHWDNHF